LTEADISWAGCMECFGWQHEYWYDTLISFYTP